MKQFKANRRISKGGIALLSHFNKIDRIHSFDIRYSLFDIRYLLFQSHCRLGWANSGFCWVSLHSTQPTFFRRHHEMRNPTTADFGTDLQQFLLLDQTGCPLAGLRGAQPNRGRAFMKIMIKW